MFDNYVARVGVLCVSRGAGLPSLVFLLFLELPVAEPIYPSRRNTRNRKHKNLHLHKF